jgi:hypothetical protein
VVVAQHGTINAQHAKFDPAPCQRRLKADPVSPPEF